MNRRRLTRILAAVAAPLAAVAVLGVAPASAVSSDESRHGGGARGCAASFDEAQRIDMEAFRDYDAETWRDLHTDDAVSILSGGQRLAGIDTIMTALAGHFTGREAQWSWTEIDRRVDACRSAFIEYETVYAIPRIGLEIRAITAVSYVRERGDWKVVLDQSTPLPAAP